MAGRESMTGKSGATVSISSDVAAVPLTLPATSVWVTVSGTTPSASGLAGVIDHVPTPVTVAVPITTLGEPPRSVMRAPGSPVP